MRSEDHDAAVWNEMRFDGFDGFDRFDAYRDGIFAPKVSSRKCVMMTNLNRKKWRNPIDYIAKMCNTIA